MNVDFLVYVVDIVIVRNVVIGYNNYLYEVGDMNEYEALRKILDPKHVFKPLRSYKRGSKFINLVLVDIEDLDTMSRLVIASPSIDKTRFFSAELCKYLLNAIIVNREVRIEEDKTTVTLEYIDLSKHVTIVYNKFREYMPGKYYVYSSVEAPNEWFADVLTPLLKFIEEHYPCTLGG